MIKENLDEQFLSEIERRELEDVNIIFTLELFKNLSDQTKKEIIALLEYDDNYSTLDAIVYLILNHKAEKIKNYPIKIEDYSKEELIIEFLKLAKEIAPHFSNLLEINSAKNIFGSLNIDQMKLVLTKIQNIEIGDWNSLIETLNKYQQD